MHRVLVIEDEPLARQRLVRLLRAAPGEREVLEAENGPEALRQIAQAKPDVVFLDVMMPKLNGYQVCEHIKQDPELKGTYVIMLTAKGQAADKVRGQEVQANEYMTKPFDPDMILQRASEILGTQT